MHRTFLTITAVCLLGVLSHRVDAADVSGSIAIPEHKDVKLDATKAVVKLTMAMQRELIPFPANFAEMTSPQKQAWYSKWLTTDDGKAYTKRAQEAFANRKTYTLEVDGNGKFVQKDVAPGSYTLTVQFFKDENPTRTSEPQADGGARVTVADQPVDVGAVKVTIRQNVNVGDMAPDFDVKTVDGKPLKLSDHRGKYVLVDFWAVWCGPCRGETPNLKATFDKFSSDKRFAMIGLSLDKDPAAPIGYAKKNDLGWIQGFLGDWGADPVTKQYGIRGIPSIWLIGLDGKVVAKGLRGARIQATIEEHMKKLPN